MIRKVLVLSVCLFSLFTSSAWAGEEQYPAKGDGNEPASADKGDKVTTKSAGDSLAKTGTDTMSIVMAASGLIVVGGVLVSSVRRRRTEELAVSLS